MKTQDKTHARYLTKTEKITHDEAVRIKEERIQYAKEKIKEAQEELKIVEDTPLQLAKAFVIEVYPGDVGYEDATTLFKASLYEGKVEWVNLPLDNQPK